MSASHVLELRPASPETLKRPPFLISGVFSKKFIPLQPLASFCATNPYNVLISQGRGEACSTTY
jgi:hypothetical protein